MNEKEIPPWLIGAGVVIFVLLVLGLWYRYLGPGSAPPPPVRVEEPSVDGLSSKARSLMYPGR
jgi:ABC-type transporter Mla subunit MlaD